MRTDDRAIPTVRDVAAAGGAVRGRYVAHSRARTIRTRTQMCRRMQMRACIPLMQHTHGHARTRRDTPRSRTPFHSPHSTPHTPLPTPHSPHPTSNTPTPYTSRPTPCHLSRVRRSDNGPSVADVAVAGGSIRPRCVGPCESRCACARTPPRRHQRRGRLPPSPRPRIYNHSRMNRTDGARQPDVGDLSKVSVHPPWSSSFPYLDVSC